MATLSLKSLQAENTALVTLVGELSDKIDTLAAQVVALAQNKSAVRPTRPENDLSVLPQLGAPFTVADCPTCAKPVRLVRDGRCEICANRTRKEQWIAAGKIRVDATERQAA